MQPVLLGALASLPASIQTTKPARMPALPEHFGARNLVGFAGHARHFTATNKTTK
jgi:sialic acid synthase SpsE